MARRANKFSAIRTKTADGISHDSKKEARKREELKLLERAGEISHLERQVRINLVVNCKFVGFTKIDFRYFDKRTKQLVLLDVKGYVNAANAATRLWKLKYKIVEAMLGVPVTIV